MSTKKTTTRTLAKKTKHTTTRRRAKRSSGGGGGEKNKGMAIVAYILFFIPLITGDYKKSQFVKFHTNQGTVLFLASIALGIAVAILTAIISVILGAIHAWALWVVIGLILNLLWLGPLVLFILGIINAANGKMNPLPIIGKFTIIK